MGSFKKITEDRFNQIKPMFQVPGIKTKDINRVWAISYATSGTIEKARDFAHYKELVRLRNRKRDERAQEKAQESVAQTNGHAVAEKQQDTSYETTADILRRIAVALERLVEIEERYQLNQTV